MRMIYNFIFLISSPLLMKSQVGGQDVFQFLNLPSSARATGLGGSLITVYDDDINLPFSNPSLLNESMDGHVSFSHNFLFGESSHGYIAYGRHVDKWGVTLHGGLKYVDYGDFVNTDVFGNTLGNFSASDYAFVLGVSKRLYERMSVGMNIRFITSQLETYSSIGLTADVSASYILEDQNALLTLVINNMGGQLSAFATEKESIPWNVQIGLSKKLANLPLRYSFIMHNLNRWNLQYNNPFSGENLFDINGNPAFNDDSNGSRIDNFFRHVIFNTEVLLGKSENVVLRMGYNHQRRKDLSVINITGFSGFAFGFGLKINRFRFDFGHGFYHQAGGTNHLTLSTHLGKRSKKRKEANSPSE